VARAGAAWQQARARAARGAGVRAQRWSSSAGRRGTSALERAGERLAVQVRGADAGGATSAAWRRASR
jgi:hypothetical protein